MGMTKVPESLVILSAEEKRNEWIIGLHESPLNYNEFFEAVLEKVAAGDLQKAKCFPKRPI